MIFTAIDPGNCSGWAIYANNELHHCGIAKPNDINFTHKTCELVIIEKPQIYRLRFQEGDQNDLITLAILVGQYKERALIAGAKVKTPTSNEWKGSIKKKIHHPRIMEALTNKERTIVNSTAIAKSYKHNMMDAIGIGLWELNRL